MTTLYAFGLTPADVLTGLADDGETPKLQSGVVTFWNQKDAGTQYTVYLASDGTSPVTEVTTLTNAGGYLPGTVSTVYSPAPSMWVDGNGGAGPRVQIVSREAADLAVAALLLADNNLDAVTSLNDLTANVQIVVRYNSGTSSYPLRPLAAGTRCVLWKGPVAPTVGGGYAVDGLDDWDQEPA